MESEAVEVEHEVLVFRLLGSRPEHLGLIGREISRADALRVLALDLEPGLSLAVLHHPVDNLPALGSPPSGLEI